jgi:hypothetical protein
LVGKRVQSRFILPAGALVACVVALASCSIGGSATLESAEPALSPGASCVVPPSSLGDATSLGNYGTGICTIRDAWDVKSLAGLRFSHTAQINCAVANRLHGWLQDVAKPAALRHYGSAIVEVQIAASFACRPRNGRSGAKLSEHGSGNAIDIAGFTLADGRSISVAKDYNGSPFWKSLRATACGRFKTVLGPGSDDSHSDHLHFDLAKRRNGDTYCH